MTANADQQQGVGARSTPIVITLIACTLLIVCVLLWPRFFPRYVDIYGGALDRWTGDECSTALSDLVRAENPLAAESCIWIGNPSRSMLRREYGGRWR
jgi:hypothetical protein